MWVIRKKSYRVAGHVFSLSMDGEERIWEALDNYEPFLIDGSGGELFSLELVPELDIQD